MEIISKSFGQNFTGPMLIQTDFTIPSPAFEFTYQTEMQCIMERNEYQDYWIVRLVVEYDFGQIDYPCESKEEFEKELIRVPEAGGKLLKAYGELTFWEDKGMAEFLAGGFEYEY